MPDRLPTVWDIDPHTKAKHYILRRYLGGWFPILSKWHGRIVYIDGFAGPGRYRGGEEGSPLIAIRTAIEHKLKLAKEIVFLFIEARWDRKKHLDQVLAEEFPNQPPNIVWKVSGAQFADEMRHLLDGLEQGGATLAPTFAFLDPFGFRGMPIDIVARLLNYKHCEALITFMEGFINRFSETQFHENALDELFGTPKWREVRNIDDPEERRQFLLALYTAELMRRVPGLYVRTFEMVDASNNILYYLVFATKSVKGMEVMKDAMWSADPTGSYRFSDRTDPSQKTLTDILDEPAWVDPAAKIVHSNFLSREVTLEEVKTFVLVKTPFPFRKKILKRLEEEGKVVAVRPRAKSGTFPDDCSIRFA